MSRIVDTQPGVPKATTLIRMAPQTLRDLADQMDRAAYVTRENGLRVVTVEFASGIAFLYEPGFVSLTQNEVPN
jgi:hypothetical protein